MVLQEDFNRDIITWVVMTISGKPMDVELPVQQTLLYRPKPKSENGRNSNTDALTGEDPITSGD